MDEEETLPSVITSKSLTPTPVTVSLKLTVKLTQLESVVSVSGDIRSIDVTNGKLESMR